MTWHTLPATSPGGSTRKTIPCVVSLFARGTQAPKIRIGFRRDQFDCPAWLEPARGVGVHVGAGEHAGWVRIVPSGDHLVRQSGGKGLNQPTLYLRLLPGVAPKARKPVPAPEIRVSPDFIEVKLPEWAIAKVVAVGPRAAPVPFSMNAMAIPDPAAAGRRTTTAVF